MPFTVVMGLVYGYIPYMILPLFGFLDRIDKSLLEAATRPRREPREDVLPDHAAAVEAGDPGRASSS